MDRDSVEKLALSIYNKRRKVKSMRQSIRKDVDRLIAILDEEGCEQVSLDKVVIEKREVTSRRVDYDKVDPDLITKTKHTTLKITSPESYTIKGNRFVKER